LVVGPDAEDEAIGRGQSAEQSGYLQDDGHHRQTPRAEKGTREAEPDPRVPRSRRGFSRGLLSSTLLLLYTLGGRETAVASPGP
jgi:hypothetical protein